VASATSTPLKQRGLSPKPVLPGVGPASSGLSPWQGKPRRGLQGAGHESWCNISPGPSDGLPEDEGGSARQAALKRLPLPLLSVAKSDLRT